MSVRSVLVSFVGTFVLLVATQDGSAAEINTYFAMPPQIKHVAPWKASMVTLDILSVRQNPLDRPWNPRVCIGCDRNNGPRSDQRHAYRTR